MIQSPDEENREELIAYLLGRLSQSDSVGGKIFCDDRSAAELESVERDLLDSYARGELNHADSAAVVLRYSASEQQREKLQFAIALRAVRRKPLRFIQRKATIALATAALVLVCFALWYWQREVRNPVLTAVARVETTAGTGPGAEPHFQDVLLSAGQTRDARIQKVILAGGVETVRFHLELPEVKLGLEFSAELRNSKSLVWSESHRVSQLEAGVSVLTVDVPSLKLLPGRYRWRLSRGPEFEFAVMARQH